MATQQQIVNALLGKPVDAPTQQPALTCVPASRGILLPCPHCGESEATITLNLSDMETMTCQECDAEFTTDDVRNIIAKWTPVLKWLDAAPTAE
jgi:uncharacterized protein (DUF983 family)